MKKTVQLTCNCEVEWSEWQAPPHGDPPHLGRYCWCDEHGDQTISEIDSHDYEDTDAVEVILSGDGGHQTPCPPSGMAFAAGERLHVWKRANRDGGVSWFYCVSGVSADGNAYESDDVELDIPHDATAETALAAARELVSEADE